MAATADYGRAPAEIKTSVFPQFIYGEMVMAYTQTQLDALDVAIAEGVLTVSFDSRTVTYRSLNEMLSIIFPQRKSKAHQAAWQELPQ